MFEAGEFSRFGNARSFAAWVGLTPSEHSSGESDRRGAITKAGNKHLRKALVEAAVDLSDRRWLELLAGFGGAWGIARSGAEGPRAEAAGC